MRAIRVSSWLTAAVLVPAALVVTTSSPAQAAGFAPADGTYVVDTTAMTITGPSTLVTGTDVDGVAQFDFDSVTIGAGVTLEVSGSRPARIASTGALTVAGSILASGTDTVSWGGAPVPGGPGGGAGGDTGHPDGVGPGGGGAPASGLNGGGGGGFGGAGAEGAQADTGFAAGAAGAVYGDLTAALAGGSGGGYVYLPDYPEYSVSGGGGGGAVELQGGSVELTASSIVAADGGHGALGGNGASGGGSGGGISIRGGTVVLAGLLSAEGGDGGLGGCCGDGGAGGGGRVLLSYGTVTETGTISVVGGSSGLVVGRGPASPQPTGGEGVVTRRSISVSTALTTFQRASTKYGKQVALRARLRADGQALGGAEVTLYTRPSAGNPWTALASVTTSSTGVAEKAVPASAPREYYWAYAGDATHDASESQVRTLRVRPALSLRTTERAVAQGDRMVLFGAVRPVGATGAVTLQQRVGGAWTSLKSRHLKKRTLPNGKTTVGYVFRLRAGKAGVQRFRVLRPAALGYALAASPVLELEVTTR